MGERERYERMAAIENEARELRARLDRLAQEYESLQRQDPPVYRVDYKPTYSKNPITTGDDQ